MALSTNGNRYTNPEHDELCPVMRTTFYGIIKRSLLLVTNPVTI